MPRKIKRKSKPTVTIVELVTLLSATVLVIFFCFWLFQLFFLNIGTELINGRSGEKLFRVFLLDPMPDSVVILHSQNDGVWMDYVLLHFKISPDDFDLILESKRWEISSSVPFGGYYTEDHSEADWWDLPSLGKNANNYSVGYITKKNKNFRIENIWVNPQKNEVFFEVAFVD